MKPTLLILAAGMGSRYGGLKQIDPMGPNGETMLDYAVRDAAAAGFGKVVFVIRKDFEDAFRKSVASRIPETLAVDYVFQQLEDLPQPFKRPEGRTKPWGTAHAVRAARNCVREPFAVINADDFYGANAYSAIARWLSPLPVDKPAAALVAYRLDHTLSEHGTVNRGICTVEAGLLRSIREREGLSRNPDKRITTSDPAGPVFDGSEAVSMNFWGFSPAVFPLLEQAFVQFLTKRVLESNAECYLPAVVDHWIASGLVQCPVLQTDSPWFGVTYPEDKEHVAASLRELEGE